MYKVNWNGASGAEKSLDFPDLDLAMKFSKSLGSFVVISGGDTEIVGKFGVDSVKEGVLPDGSDYSWCKRRTPTGV
jgi:hypothetical protein